MKACGLTIEVHSILDCWSAGEVMGIPSVAVKCIEIRRNTGGEGALLDCN